MRPSIESPSIGSNDFNAADSHFGMAAVAGRKTGMSQVGTLALVLYLLLAELAEGAIGTVLALAHRWCRSMKVRLLGLAEVRRRPSSTRLRLLGLLLRHLVALRGVLLLEVRGKTVRRELVV